MNTDSSDSLEWIDAENTLLKDICRIEQFHWGQRYVFDEGPDHGKYNFIRLLDNKINKSEFREILATQGKYFQERAKTLHLKIPSSVFKEPPAYLNGLIPTGTPLTSILIRHESLPLIEGDSRISIVECKTLQDLEIFIEVNASGRDWPLDHSVYEMTRHTFSDRESDHFYYLLYVDDKPACTATILQFGGKYNLNLLSTHKQFQRRGLMHYLNIWIAQNLNKDFYVQVNHNEPSYIYYSQLAGAEVVNTEVKYVVKSEHSGQ